jgi:hypothetical protein
VADEPNGNGADNPNGKDDTAKYVTPEQLNKAITAHLSRFEKNLSQRDDALLKKIDERFATNKPAQPEGDDPEGKAAKEGGDDKDDQVEKLKRKFDREMADMRKRLEKADTDRELERKKSLDTALRQTLAENLLAAGVDATRQKHALGYLVDATRSVYYNDDGKIVFRGVDGLEHDLNDGLSAWVTSDDAKIYLPPRGATGSGDRGGGSASPPSGQPDRKQQAANTIIKSLLEG